MSKNKTENQEVSHYLNIDNIGIDFSEVVMINFSNQSDNPIILHLKSGVNIHINNTSSDMSNRELFEFVSNYLESISKFEHRTKVNTFELLKSILSELKLISEKLEKI